MRNYEKFLLLFFVLSNGLFYCALLPLWEGFDEQFHYGYVQALSVERRIPRFGHTVLSAEVIQSMLKAPFNHIPLPGGITDAEWFTLTPAQRAAHEKDLLALSPQLRYIPSTFPNYEAAQCPLAYLLMLPVDLALARVPIPQRILLIRLIITTLATLACYAGVMLLSRAVDLQEPYRLAAFICLFETQMFWGTVAHVGNDWLAVAASVLFFGCLACFARSSQTKYALALSCSLTIGLLAKGYFLAFVPIFLAVLLFHVWRGRLGLRSALVPLAIPVVPAFPWYARNVLLYGNLSGMQQTIRGVDTWHAVDALKQLNWFQNTVSLARWSLWTGNWSFTSFSKNILNFEIILLSLALFLFSARYRKINSPEIVSLAALFSFSLGLVYYICLAWADTSGVSQTAAPWYTQAVVPVIWIFAFLGWQRIGAWGRSGAIALLLTSTWIALLTYAAKLLPYYGGYRGRATLSAVWQWWRDHSFTALWGITLLPPAGIEILFGLYLVSLFLVTGIALRKFLSPAQ